MAPSRLDCGTSRVVGWRTMNDERELPQWIMMHVLDAGAELGWQTDWQVGQASAQMQLFPALLPRACKAIKRTMWWRPVVSAAETRRFAGV